jgi:hypothetical protein
VGKPAPPLLLPHTIPQPPQLFGSLWVFTHVATPASTQAVSPAVKHPQMPLTHDSPVTHTMLQPPQLFGSVWVFTHVATPASRQA